MRPGKLLLGAAAAAAALALLAPGAPASLLHPAASPTVEYDRAAALAGRTYSWGGTCLQVPSYADFIKGAVDKDLAKRGWQMVNSGGSVTVFALGDIHSGDEIRQCLGRLDPSFVVPEWGTHGLGAGWKPGYGEPTINALGTGGGHLVITMYDGGTHQPLFRGVADEDLSGTEKQNDKALGGVLKQMFKKFPPRHAGK